MPKARRIKEYRNGYTGATGAVRPVFIVAKGSAKVPWAARERATRTASEPDETSRSLRCPSGSKVNRNEAGRSNDDAPMCQSPHRKSFEEQILGDSLNGVRHADLVFQATPPHRRRDAGKTCLLIFARVLVYHRERICEVFKGSKAGERR